MSFITGTRWPPKLLPGAVDISSAIGGPSLANVIRPESALYPLQILVGGHGLFTMTPVLLLGVWGLARASRSAPFGDAWLWRSIAAGVTAQYLGHAFIAGSYGGWSYGFRYLIPIEPLLLFAAPAVLAQGAARSLFAIASPASVVFALLGAYHPWPPAYEQATNRDPIAALVTMPAGGNAAAWCAHHLDDATACEWLGSRFISPDRAMRYQYLVVFFGSKGDLARVRRFQ